MNEFTGLRLPTGTGRQPTPELAKGNCDENTKGVSPWVNPRGQPMGQPITLGRSLFYLDAAG